MAGRQPRCAYPTVRSRCFPSPTERVHALMLVLTHLARSVDLVTVSCRAPSWIDGTTTEAQLSRPRPILPVRSGGCWSETAPWLLTPEATAMVYCCSCHGQRQTLCVRWLSVGKFILRSIWQAALPAGASLPELCHKGQPAVAMKIPFTPKFESHDFVRCIAPLTRWDPGCKLFGDPVG